MPILATKNLTKRFEAVVAVGQLSVNFEKGQITGIIGPNGSGKTTLTNLLSGVLKIDQGRIVVQGIEIKQIQPYELPSYGLTRTFQEVRLFEQMTVLDNILAVLTERSVLNSLLEKHSSLHLKQAENFLTKVNLWQKKDGLAVNLSYGQRKLLEIIRAIAMNVEIYLFDEPFAGLFPEMIKLVANLFQALKLKGKTIILIEHNMDLIRQMCDFAIVMDSGQLLAQGQPTEVLAKPEVIEAYLGE